MLPVFRGHEAIVQMLRDDGRTKMSRNQWGVTAMDYAMELAAVNANCVEILQKVQF